MDQHTTFELTRRHAVSHLAAGLGLVAAGGSALALQGGTSPPSGPTITPVRDPSAPAPAPKGWGRIAGFDRAKNEYVLPPLPYAPKALEPHIDGATMDLHHGRHHAAYVAGANRAMRELGEIRDGGDAGLVRHWARELSFHLGGHVNHCLFWHMMAPLPAGQTSREPVGPLADAIRRDFGSFDKFVAHFKANALQVEGGGWGWLVFDPLSRRLGIIQMESQQDRFVAGTMPILGVDVWEHAYYLKYQNKRAEYVDAFMNVVNWPFCEELFAQATA